MIASIDAIGCGADVFAGRCMEWTIEYVAQHGIVYVRVAGRVTSALADEMLLDALAYARDHASKRLLVDHTHASLDMGMVEIHRRPLHYEAIGLERGHRLAIVFAEWTADAVFLEAVIGGPEYHRRVFADVDDAVAWLASDKP